MLLAVDRLPAGSIHGAGLLLPVEVVIVTTSFRAALHDGFDAIRKFLVALVGVDEPEVLSDLVYFRLLLLHGRPLSCCHPRRRRRRDGRGSGGGLRTAQKERAENLPIAHHPGRGPDEARSRRLGLVVVVILPVRSLRREAPVPFVLDDDLRSSRRRPTDEPCRRRRTPRGSSRSGGRPGGH